MAALLSQWTLIRGRRVNTGLFLNGSRWTVDPETDCWNWNGRLLRGYGTYGRHRAQRLMWEITNGEIPAGYDIHHRCENPSCVNPDHLEPRKHGPHQAEHQRDFTVAEVAQICRMAASGEVLLQDIADQFGVPRTTISNIVQRKRYIEYEINAMPARKCALCGADVIGRRRTAKFCCVEHRIRWNDIKRLERARARTAARKAG